MFKKALGILSIPALLITVLATMSSAAIRPTPPSGPITTTTTTPLPDPSPSYTAENPFVIPCAGTAPYLAPVENWSVHYDIRNGDYVQDCWGNLYLYTGDEDTSTPGNCLAATIASDLFSGHTYEAGHRFSPTADSEFQGDTQRLRMKVYDANSNRVQTQNRWEENNDWGKDKNNLDTPFRLKKSLPSGTYTVEITAWFYEEVDGCGPTVTSESTVIAIG